MKPLCFVLMPFGRKADATGRLIDFDRIFEEIITPAITAAGLEPLRADHETAGGIIHKPMFERLILCPYAVADLTLANANVYYELGVRHAFRPWSTVPIISDDNRLPFDVQGLRTVHYKLGADGTPDDAACAGTVAGIANLLKTARDASKDSPVYQLVDGLQEPVVPHTKTDVFRAQVQYSDQMKTKLATARKAGVDAVRGIEADLGPIGDVEAGVVIDLFLSYRARKAWDDMVALVDRMSRPLAETVMVREQLALALNRLGRRDEAESIITKLIEERGPSSESYGILGRIQKDRWEDACKADGPDLAQGCLEQAIEAYLKGFESDWRDAYPGVNAVTLMELHNPPDPRRTALIPVVRYAAERRIAGKPDYWDYATVLELAILGGDEKEARVMLPKALACIREPWEPETTARNLRLIREARETQGGAPAWATELEDVLKKRAARG